MDGAHGAIGALVVQAVTLGSRDGTGHAPTLDRPGTEIIVMGTLMKTFSVSPGHVPVSFSNVM